MPDRDVFSRCAPSEWRRPLRLLHGNASPAETGDACLSALAQTLRLHGGLAKLPECADLIDKYRTGALSAAEVFSHIRELERGASFDMHTRMLANTVRGLVAQQSVPTSQESTRIVVAERCLRSMIASRVFEIERPEFTVFRFRGNVSVQSSFERECFQAISSSGRLRSLARKLCDDPSGRTARLAPRRILRSTAEWLTQSLT